MSGLHVWLLDGENDPYNVLPLDLYGELPRMQDVETFVAERVECPEPY